MNGPPAGAHQLASRLLQHESGGTTGAGAIADALESAWRQLGEGLEPLVGTGGTYALIARAVSLARREFPFLGTVRLVPGARADFTAIRDSLTSQDDALAEAAGVAVLERLLGLLTGLLGEELGLWPVRAIWPDAVRAALAAHPTDGEA